MSKTINIKAKRTPKQHITTIEIGKMFYFVAQDAVCEELKCQRGTILLAKMLETEQKHIDEGKVLCEITKINTPILIPVNTSVASFDKIKATTDQINTNYLIGTFSG